MRRWLVACLALGIALLALYGLATGPEPAPPAGSDQIGERSREGLRQILREAESAEDRAANEAGPGDG